MKRYSKRFFSLLLVAVMLASVTACSEKGGQVQESEQVSTESSAENTETVVQMEETEKILPDLPADLNFDDAEVRIAQHPNIGGDWSDWCSRDLYVESVTGEPINDAVFERNAYVEEKLGVKLNIIENESMTDAMRKQATSGTGDFHILPTRIVDMTSVALGGYAMNLFKMPYMDLSRPWYDAGCIEEASFYNQLYYVTGSMLILDDDSTGAMVFNKQMIKDFQLQSPYSIVLEGTWTLDRFFEQADAVHNDENGNGKVELGEDRFGILCQRDSIISFLHAADCRIVSKDEEGNPVFTLGSERAINLMDKLDGFMFKKEVVQNIHDYEGKYPDIYAEECNVFRDERALFMWIRMRVAENLRDMETDFGIIPVPKLTEDQPVYTSMVSKYTAGTIAIPNDASLDLNLCGAVVELMSAEGHYGLREAYYETSLGGKVVRDPESTDMLDIIIGNRIYDAGEIYDIGGMSGKLYSLTQQDSISLSTLMAKSSKMVNKLMERAFVQPLQELAEQGR